jgi:hypothetical protein
LPHRSPEEQLAQTNQLRTAMQQLAAQSARQRRWLDALAAGVVAFMILGAATTVYLVNAVALTPAPTDPPASKADVARSEPKDTKPSAVALAKETSVPATAAKAKPAAEPGDTKEVFLETLGGLSAAHLYQSYLNIGLLADGVENKAITIEAATRTLKIVTNCLSLVDRKLAKLNKAALDPDDHESLEQIKTVVELLRLQTQTLLAYWATGAAEQGEDYERTRKVSWTGLSKVLGLDAMP